MRQKPIQKKQVKTEYSVHGTNTWEQLTHAKGQLREDLKHVVAHEIEKYAFDTSKNRVQLLIKIPEKTQINESTFSRARKAEIQ